MSRIVLLALYETHCIDALNVCVGEQVDEADRGTVCERPRDRQIDRQRKREREREREVRRREDNARGKTTVEDTYT